MPAYRSHPPVFAPVGQNRTWERLTDPLRPKAAGISRSGGPQKDEHVPNKHSRHKYALSVASASRLPLAQPLGEGAGGVRACPPPATPHQEERQVNEQDMNTHGSGIRVWK
jgi:hypothetical protein